MNLDLKLIKDKYGEEMMHLCRKLFPTLLETDGLLFKLLSNSFDYSKKLYNDLVRYNKINEFKDYIYSLADTIVDYNYDSGKTAKELLKEKGYTLYEIKTDQELQSFKKYYVNGEMLCSFTDQNRLKDNYVFFAVRDDAESLNRDDFEITKREDKYGSSVLSIQFTKGDINTLHITSRYNHRVFNPDATYSNNLEKIAGGLTNAFEKDYHLKIESNKGDFTIPEYVRAEDGKFYKYNITTGNNYICQNNIIIKDGKVTKYDKEKYIIFDYFILDLQNNKIKSCLNCLMDSFCDSLDINKIEVFNNKENKTKKIVINKEIIIVINDDNKMIYYRNPIITKIDDSFLYNSGYLDIQEIDLPNVLELNNGFLEYNKSLEKASLESVVKIGDYCFNHNKKLKEIYLPNVEVIGKDFLVCNKDLKELSLPNVKQIGNNFIYCNRELERINVPNVIRIGNAFLDFNTSLKEIYLPNVETIGDSFLSYNNDLERIYAPKLVSVGKSFLFDNRKVKEISFPSLVSTNNSFFANNDIIEYIDLENLETIGDDFFRHNRKLTKISLPKLKEIEDGFLYDNNQIELDLPSLSERSRDLLDNLRKEYIDKEITSFIIKKYLVLNKK